MYLFKSCRSFIKYDQDALNMGFNTCYCEFHSDLIVHKALKTHGFTGGTLAHCFLSMFKFILVQNSFWFCKPKLLTSDLIKSIGSLLSFFFFFFSYLEALFPTDISGSLPMCNRKNVQSFQEHGLLRRLKVIVT